jgi:ClpP class serine protease
MIANINDSYKMLVSYVKNGRKDRLIGSHGDIFEGLVWSGTAALRLGLADGIASEGMILQRYDLSHSIDYTYGHFWIDGFIQELKDSNLF